MPLIPAGDQRHSPSPRSLAFLYIQQFFPGRPRLHSERRTEVGAVFRHLGGRWEGSYTLSLISIGSSCSRRVMSYQLLSDTRRSERRGQRLGQPSDCNGQNLDPPSGQSCRRALSGSQGRLVCTTSGHLSCQSPITNFNVRTHPEAGGLEPTHTSC